MSLVRHGFVFDGLIIKKCLGAAIGTSALATAGRVLLIHGELGAVLRRQPAAGADREVGSDLDRAFRSSTAASATSAGDCDHACQHDDDNFSRLSHPASPLGAMRSRPLP